MSIVVVYTPDPPGHAALDLGIAEAQLRGLELIVVNASTGQGGRRSRDVGSSEVGSIEELLAEAGVQHTIKRPTGPDLADTVLEEVERSAAELLVVGLRRRTPVGKLIMGSVAQRLLLDSPVPVFAIHGER